MTQEGFRSQTGRFRQLKLKYKFKLKFRRSSSLARFRQRSGLVEIQQLALLSDLWLLGLHTCCRRKNYYSHSSCSNIFQSHAYKKTRTARVHNQEQKDHFHIFCLETRLTIVKPVQ